MDDIILVIETIGAWLLFGAPLLQATTELYEEISGWDKIKNMNHSAKRKIIGKNSFWWWLIPPFKIYLEKRRIRKIQTTYSDIKLSDDTLRSLRKFSLKVNGWSGVTLGGWFVAISTTWDLVQHFEFGIEAWLLLVVLFSLASTLVNIKLTRKQAR